MHILWRKSRYHKLNYMVRFYLHTFQKNNVVTKSTNSFLLGQHSTPETPETMALWSIYAHLQVSHFHFNKTSIVLFLLNFEIKIYTCTYIHVYIWTRSYWLNAISLYYLKKGHGPKKREKSFQDIHLVLYIFVNYLQQLNWAELSVEFICVCVCDFWEIHYMINSDQIESLHLYCGVN